MAFELRRIGLDTFAGMSIPNLIAPAIMLTTHHGRRLISAHAASEFQTRRQL
jgi:hypothetical protein